MLQWLSLFSILDGCLVQRFTVGTKTYHWNKNLPILNPATSPQPQKIPLGNYPKKVWLDRFTRPKRRVKDGFWLEYAAPDLKINAKSVPKLKNKRSAEKIGGKWSRQDFDSIL
jgi:hypothetical protein